MQYAYQPQKRLQRKYKLWWSKSQVFIAMRMPFTISTLGQNHVTKTYNFVYFTHIHVPHVVALCSISMQECFLFLFFSSSSSHFIPQYSYNGHFTEQSHRALLFFKLISFLYSLSNNLFMQ